MKDHDTLWAVVEVWRGIPVDVQLFRHYEAAVAQEQQIRARMDVQYDETGVFEICLEAATPDPMN